MTGCAKGCGRRATRRGLCASHYEQRRTRDTAYGRWRTMFVPAEPIRAHIAKLIADGMSKRDICAQAGVSRTMLRSLLVGRPGRGEVKPSSKVAISTAEKLMRVTFQPSRLPAGTGIDAWGTTRRLRALVAIGYTQSELCRRLGWLDSNGTRLFTGKAVTVRKATAEKVAALYDELAMLPGASQRARNHAARKRWAPPLAWDDDLIDDPNGRPDFGPAATRKTIPFPEQYQEMRDLGFSNTEIAARLGIQMDSLLRQLMRHNMTGAA